MQFAFSSIVLLAVCDAEYRFTFVSVGTPGRWSDGGIFDKSPLPRAIEENLIEIPKAKALPGNQTPITESLHLF